MKNGKITYEKPELVKHENLNEITKGDIPTTSPTASPSGSAPD